MEGTATLEMEPLLNLEIDFEFTPGKSERLNCHPDFAEPGYGPEYDFQEIRVFHQGQWHQVPDWLFEILNSQYDGFGGNRGPVVERPPEKEASEEILWIEEISKGLLRITPAKNWKASKPGSE